MSGNAMDPSLTDQEILAKFTPIQREFYEWQKAGGNIKDIPAQDLEGFLEKEFPKASEAYDILDEWVDYLELWGGRHQRRFWRPMTQNGLIRFIKKNPCTNLEALDRTVLSLQVHDTPDIILGQSDFGGLHTGYCVTVNPHFLEAPFPVAGKDNALFGSTLLNPAVLCFDTEEPAMPLQPQTLTRPMPTSPARGKKDLNPASNHVYFFQLGELRACSGKAWHQARNKPEHELKDLEWKHTGFSIVLTLDSKGYATDRVLVLYNDSMEKLRKQALAEIDSSMNSDFEIPEPGVLYHGCKEQFFAAMLNLNLGQLKHKTAFKFDVKMRRQRQLQRTTLHVDARNGPSVTYITSPAAVSG